VTLQRWTAQQPCRCSRPLRKHRLALGLPRELQLSKLPDAKQTRAAPLHHHHHYPSHHRQSHSNTLLWSPLLPCIKEHTSTATMATVPVSEVKSNARESRTAAHSHIKGLGLSSDGRATPSAGGFIGQAAAREVHGTLWVSACIY
jgi:hypothetical protein